MRRMVDQAGLEAVAHQLGGTLSRGAVIWLEGELGAGKTTFARALAASLGAQVQATSPTYDLVHAYPGSRGPVYHVDCYRLRHPEEAHDLDWAGMAGGVALLIEWPERAGAWAPPPTCTVRLAHGADPLLRDVEVQ
jgi:tRNA threonylcarbamoyladenosine biosynthesis protein TsaE